MLTQNKMYKSVTEIRIRYADTDQMRFVYNGKYLEFFEVGRTELLREAGLPYAEVEKHGYLLPVTEAFVKYLKPARYDDILVIETTYPSMASAGLRLEYRVFRKETMEQVAEGYTSHVFLKADTYRITRPPEFFIKKLEPFFKSDD